MGLSSTSCPGGRASRITTLGLTIAAVLTALAVLAPIAAAQNVQPGIDIFTTPIPPVGATTSATFDDFSFHPLPAGYFCPTSAQFSDKVYYKGSNFPGIGPYTGIDFRWRTTDTVVRRLAVATLPTNGSQATIPIEIVALNLVSVQPITVNCPGDTQWDVNVCLSSAAPQTQGTMTIRKVDSTGGTFTSNLPVLPKITFTSRTTFAQKVIDFGAMMLPPVTFTGAHGNWVYNPSPTLSVTTITVPPNINIDGNCDGVFESISVGTTNFHPGVIAVHPMLGGWGQVPVVYSVTKVKTEGEGLFQPDAAHIPPNDLFAIGAGPFGRPAGAGELLRGGELFQSSGAVLGAAPDISTVDRISASWGVSFSPGAPPFMGPFLPSPGGTPQARAGLPGTMGLQPSDEIDALSFGQDGGQVLIFSVRDDADGIAGTAVNFHSTVSPPAAALSAVNIPSNGGGNLPGNGGESGGDLFSSALFPQFGGANGPPIPPIAGPGSNLLYLDESLLGLQAPANRYSILGVQEDDLDAVELSDAKTVDDPADGIPDNTVGPPFRFVYFSLGPGSPSLFPVDPYPGLVAPAADPNGVTPDDILVSHTGGAFGDFAIYARGVADIGLLPGDNLNSLVLWKTAPFDRLNPGPGADEALFTLSPGSPSLVAGANPRMPAGLLTPATVFHTDFVSVPGNIFIYATAAALGLDNDDVIDALDIGGVWGGGPGGGGPDGGKPMTAEESLWASHGVVHPQCKSMVGSQCNNIDTDGDGIPDDADNAMFTPNHLQGDADFDMVGDLVDDCPFVADPSQADTDGDRVGDACDNCPLLFNPGQCNDGDECTLDSCSNVTGCSNTPVCVQFCNAANITINDNGPAAPYPSTITVSGAPTVASIANVKLQGITHTFPDDIDILLVGPGGQNALIMSDAGGPGDVTNVSLKLTDSAASFIPDEGLLVSGTYKPTNIGTGDTFAAPAPAPSGGSALSTFNSTNPNGSWKLFVVDDAAVDIGSISGGWCLNVRTVSCVINADCSDGNLCNGVETCSGGQCFPGTPVNCDDGLFCTLDVCDVPTGTCGHPVNPCNDSDACTTDSCDEANNVCVYGNTCKYACNNTGIALNDGATPPTPASPYPSSISVSGLGSVLAVESVQLQNITHTFPDDLDILLASPTGQNATILSDAGGSVDVTNVTLTLSDSAASLVADAGPLVSGTFRPTNIAQGPADTWPAPAPVPGGGSALSVFAGTSPNGNWNLFSVDDTSTDSGTMATGWCLKIRTSCTALFDVNNSVMVTKPGPGSSNAQISWSNPPGPFNVYRGKRTNVPWSYNQVCLASSVSGPVSDPSPVIPAGGTYWYLVTRRSSCTESGLGPASNGVERPGGNPCP